MFGFEPKLALPKSWQARDLWLPVWLGSIFWLAQLSPCTAVHFLPMRGELRAVKCFTQKLAAQILEGLVGA
jgi:hypothetical protein